MNLPKGNILVLTSWSFREPLTTSYLLPYIKIIRKQIRLDQQIWIQTLEKKHLFPSKNERDIIHSELISSGIKWLPLSYRPFGPIALLMYFSQIIRLILFCRKNKIETLHAFAPPAAMTAVLLRMFVGKRLVIDSWEPHAESMVETGTWKKNSIAFHLLWWGEQRAAKKADVLIAASMAMKSYGEKKYGALSAPVYHRPGCVDTQEFDPAKFMRDEIRKEHGLENKIVCACVSKLGGLYLTKEVFSLFAAGQQVFGNQFHALLLCANPKNEVEVWAKEAGYELHRYTHLHVSHNEVAGYLAACDMAFNPQKPVASKRYGTPVKDGEYWAMGLPLIILPDISEDSGIVENERAGVILKDLRAESMIQAMRDMQTLMKEEGLQHRIRLLAEKYRSYKIAESVYAAIYKQD